MGPEAKLYQKLRKSWSDFSLTRLENLSSLGTPDLLVSNNNSHFFTIELKVSRGKALKFSSHQLAFHLRHPKNTFILTKTLGPCSPNTSPVSMFHGSRIRELAACGLKLDACYSGWEACRLALEELGA